MRNPINGTMGLSCLNQCAQDHQPQYVDEPMPEGQVQNRVGDELVQMPGGRLNHGMQGKVIKEPCLGGRLNNRKGKDQGHNDHKNTSDWRMNPALKESHLWWSFAWSLLRLPPIPRILEPAGP